MYFRLLGVVLVVFACGAFGFSLAANLRSEIRCLHELNRVLDFMESELNYRLTPLPQLSRLVAEHSEKLGSFFMAFSEELESQIAPDASHCMEIAVCKHSSLPAETKECLLLLGRSLGKFDLQGQLVGLAAVRESCNSKLKRLEDGRDVRMRSYQTLGLCAGAALAILLI